MFLVTWLFDKLGYMPKINVEVGKVESWPFPVLSEDFEVRPRKKPVARKPTTKKKPAVVAKTTRTKKAK